MRSAFRRAETLGATVLPLRVPDIAALNAVARVILLAEASAVVPRARVAKINSGCRASAATTA